VGSKRLILSHKFKKSPADSAEDPFFQGLEHPEAPSFVPPFVPLGYMWKNRGSAIFHGSGVLIMFTTSGNKRIGEVPDSAII
jgi:hypothetical protein